MAPTSPEQLQPAWRPGPFIPVRDWTSASRRVGLQQFCRAQISLPAQSKPLAGRGICYFTFLIYTSPPSHTQSSVHRLSRPCYHDLQLKGEKNEYGVEVQREQQHDMFNRVLETLHKRVAAVGGKLCLSVSLTASEDLSSDFTVA